MLGGAGISYGWSLGQCDMRDNGAVSRVISVVGKAQDVTLWIE